MHPARLLARAREAAEQQRGWQVIRLCSLAINQHPEPALSAELRLLRGRANAGRGQWQQAEFDARWVVDNGPSAAARALLARCLAERACPAEAVEQLEVCLEAGERAAWCWELYARSLSQLNRHSAATEAARWALTLEPGPGTLATLLAVLAAAGEHAHVAEVADRQRRLVSGSAELSTHWGYSLNALGRSDQAIAAFRRAERLEPGRHDTQCGLAHALLRLGFYDEGWRCNEHRQKDAGSCPRLGVPAWQGETLAGKRLLVKHEQGLGDNLQFSRFLPVLRERGALTTFLAPARLARVLRSNPALGPIATGHPGFGAADYQTLVMSLPHHLKLGGELTGCGQPYLFPEPELVALWRKRLPARPRVGLAWQGNPNYAGEPWRSLPLSKLAPLVTSNCQCASFVSLQKNFGAEQLDASPLTLQVANLGPSIDNGSDAFVDSLAILSLLDLFITTDTGLAHLAGAAGVRTWLLLSKVCDWRWGVEGRSTAWYPSLRLFRQTRGGDWDAVIHELAESLASLRLEGGSPVAAGERVERAAQGARQFGSKSAAR